MHLPWVYVHSAIYETYLVSWFSRHLCSIGGGGGVTLPCIMVFQRSMLNWRRGVCLPLVYVHSSICETFLV